VAPGRKSLETPELRGWFPLEWMVDHVCGSLLEGWIV